MRDDGKAGLHQILAVSQREVVRSGNGRHPHVRHLGAFGGGHRHRRIDVEEIFQQVGHSIVQGRGRCSGRHESGETGLPRRESQQRRFHNRHRRRGRIDHHARNRTREGHLHRQIGRRLAVIEWLHRNDDRTRPGGNRHASRQGGIIGAIHRRAQERIIHRQAGRRAAGAGHRKLPRHRAGHLRARLGCAQRYVGILHRGADGIVARIRDINDAAAVHRHAAGIVKLRGAAVGIGAPGDAGITGQRADHPARRDFSQHVVARKLGRRLGVRGVTVDHVEIAGTIDLDAPRHVKERLAARTILIPGHTRQADIGHRALHTSLAGQCADHPAGSDLPNHFIVVLGHIQVVGAIDRNANRAVEKRQRARAIHIPGHAGLAGNGCDRSIRGYFPNRIIAVVGHKDIARAIHGDSFRIIKRRRRRCAVGADRTGRGVYFPNAIISLISHVEIIGAIDGDVPGRTKKRADPGRIGAPRRSGQAAIGRRHRTGG